MKIELWEIPNVPDAPSNPWKVRVLAIDGRSPALTALDGWAQKQAADFKKIIKSLRYASQTTRVHNEKFVKKCANPDHGDVYEARADKGHARLMFFYSPKDGSVIVCTNSFWKGQGSQDNAFGQCAKLKALFDQFYS